MFRHTQTISGQQPTNSLSVFGHFVELALKGLMAVVLNNSRILLNLGYCSSLRYPG